MMLEIKDIAFAYLEGYIHAKVTEHLLQGKVLNSDLDKVKKIAVECMKDYISQLNLPDKEKKELKQNHEQWSDLPLKGIKQRIVRLQSDIYSKPLLRKPALGKMPSYLEADEPVLLSTAQEQRMLKEKAKVMLGVADKDSFKTLIARTKDELQRDAYH